MNDEIITRYNYKAQFKLIWNALHFYHEEGISENNKENNQEWDDICTVMAWWKDEIGLSDEDFIAII